MGHDQNLVLTPNACNTEALRYVKKRGDTSRNKGL